MARPVHEEQNETPIHGSSNSDSGQEKVIAVRITSSVAVGRGKSRSSKTVQNPTPSTTTLLESSYLTTLLDPHLHTTTTTQTPDLSGANMEFIKQLNSKKTRGLQNFEKIHSFPPFIRDEISNRTDDSIAESSLKSVFFDSSDGGTENEEDVPLARSIAASSNNHVHNPTSRPLREQKITTVNFNVVHETSKQLSNYDSQPSEAFVDPNHGAADTPMLFSQPNKFYSEPPRIYSQPAQVYSEPAKFYSEPAKIYSEPAKVYSEPAKVYGEPAKVYSEPAKFYSQPASLHLTPGVTDYTWQHNPNSVSSTSITPASVTLPPVELSTQTQRNAEHQPEKNYEVDEKVSVMTDGRRHGEQESQENCKQENCKVGYVVEGRQYRKYRVEERTADGFIVGEYGVVRNEDGALRGVRYTADSDASPRLIHDALMKFLTLK